MSELLSWGRNNRRNYPFRRTRDGYKILVCEVLLRKTTARQVSNVYQKFFTKFPKVEDLASASPKEIFEIIQPLGIWSRAQELSSIAREIVDKYGGKIPADLVALTKMKGVGRYIASCVLAVAYDKSVPMVDSNVERVICRLFRLKAMGKGVPKEEVWKAYSQLAPFSGLREFHYAIIDLSHEICRSKNPRCNICPLVRLCGYSKSIGRNP
jgi:A/G-specific adenine glycosylase